MLQNMVMPKLGDTMEEGTIVKWLVKEGDRIRKGNIVMEIETDKANLEVESLLEGLVLKILVKESETVPVGTNIAYIGEADDHLPEDAVQDGEAAGAAETGKTAAAHSESQPVDGFQRVTNQQSRATASPRALKLAIRLGIDISEVRGSGPGGRITSSDVQSLYDSKHSH